MQQGVVQTIRDLAVRTWSACSYIYIESPAKERIAIFPLDFLLTSGDNTWSYIYKTIRLLVRSTSGQVVDSSNQPVTEGEKEPPEAGHYVYRGKKASNKMQGVCS